MALAGYATTLKVAGTAVPVVNEASTGLGGGVWQVTNTARRIWEPSAAVTVKDAAVTVAANLWSFDYLFGKVTFTGYTPSGAVTVDGSYLPTGPVAEVRSFNLSIKPNILDRTTFDSGGVKQKLSGLGDASGSFEFLSMPTADLDAGTGGDQSLVSFNAGAVFKVFELKVGTWFFRAFIAIESIEESAQVDGLVQGTANFQTAPQRAGAAMGFGQ